MAVGVGALEVSLDQRIPIGSGRAIYIGSVVTAGTEYPTGGASLEEASTSRHKLPERFDWIFVGSIFPSNFAAPNKVKLLAANTVTAEKSGLIELKAKESMATPLKGAVFFAVGNA